MSRNPNADEDYGRLLAEVEGGYEERLQVSERGDEVEEWLASGMSPDTLVALGFLDLEPSDLIEPDEQPALSLEPRLSAALDPRRFDEEPI